MDKGAVCSDCGKELVRNNRLGRCPACYRRKYRGENHEAIKARTRVWKRNRDFIFRDENAEFARFERLRLRLEVIAAYGGKCVCCGEQRPLFLTVDHVYGDGKADRELYGSGLHFYRVLRRLGWPRDKYRLLCFNCNTAIGFWGVCPHELEKYSEYDGLFEDPSKYRSWTARGQYNRRFGGRARGGEGSIGWEYSGDSAAAHSHPDEEAFRCEQRVLDLQCR